MWSLLWAVLPSPCEALHKTIHHATTEHLWSFLEYDIGLEPGATIEIDLVNDRPSPNVYVMVLTHEQWRAWQREEPLSLPGEEGNDNSPGGLNSHLVSHWRGALQEHLQTKFNASTPTKDRFYIGVLNVQEHTMQLHGNISMTNPGGQQLPLQEQQVPPVLLATSGLFFASCALYTVLVLLGPRRSRTEMHGLMGAALLLKGCVLLLWWVDYRQVAATGFNNTLGQIGWQLLDKIQTILELMLFLLTALGWKFLRPTLNIHEKRFAYGISVISMYLGVFEVACTSQATCSGYQLSRYILHSLCYLVVIVAMNFNLQMVGAQIQEGPANLESGKLYRKHNAYQVFRWIFLAFIIAPTVELFLKVTVMPWDAVWLYVLLQQLRTWGIYVSIIVAFALLPHPPPLRVFELTRESANSDEEIDEISEIDEIALAEAE